MKTFGYICLSILLILVIALPIFFNATPMGKAMWNNWFHAVQKVDDDTNYKTLKKVEDTCRSMIASYEADKLTYEQYKDSDNEEKQSWAEQAKMRANKTASSYNNYILKNSYVWKNNVPDDIYLELQIIE
jgi:hypothetical protein